MSRHSSTSRWRLHPWRAVGLVVVLAACSAPGSGTNDITVAEAFQRQQAGAVLVDIRTPREHRGGHPPGTRLVPWGGMKRGFVSKVAEVVDPSQEVLVICESGYRSVPASHALRDAGYSSVFNVLGGTYAWRRQGLPWERGR
jgi:rhodanese-related sulfurtransferase